MTKSELIEVLAKKQPHLALKDVELAVKCIIEKMNQHYLPVKELRLEVLAVFLCTSALRVWGEIQKPVNL